MDEHVLNRHRRRLIVYALLCVLIMAAIFVMSAKDGHSSGDLSGKPFFLWLARVLQTIVPWTIQLSPILLIRKCAHMFEYFCLGCSTFLFTGELLWRTEKRLGKTAAIAFLWCFLYACSDEWHQKYVPGRAGVFTDVLIDSIGVVCAVLLLCLITWLSARKKRAAQ